MAIINFRLNVHFIQTKYPNKYRLNMTIDCAIKLKGWPKNFSLFVKMLKIYRAFVFRITFATRMEHVSVLKWFAVFFFKISWYLLITFQKITGHHEDEIAKQRANHSSIKQRFTIHIPPKYSSNLSENCDRFALRCTFFPFLS